MNWLHAAVFPPFRPRVPWIGGDLQTARNLLRRAVPKPACRYTTEQLSLRSFDSDEDAVDAILERPMPGLCQPLVVVVHGLAASRNHPGVLETAKCLLELGYPVLRVNLPGASLSGPVSRRHYDASSAGHLARALESLGPTLLGQGLVLVGLCLGGTIVLNAAALHARRLPLRAVVSFSAPLDLRLSARSLNRPRNALYQRRLMSRYRQEYLRTTSLSTKQRRLLQDCRTIQDLDRILVAPSTGYQSARAYYDDNSPVRVLNQIRCPGLVIHALDDPLVPATTHLSHSWHESPKLRPLLSRSGGHLGFHCARTETPWHLRCLQHLLASAD